MTDRLTNEKRSWNMSQIRNKDTTIEVLVRRFLFKEGFRYRKNVSILPGKPDIVLPRYRTVVFIHGCFWHRHEGCSNATMPKTRTEIWKEKFDRNIANDILKENLLKKDKWNVITIWECEIENNFAATMEKLVLLLNNNSKPSE